MKAKSIFQALVVVLVTSSVTKALSPQAGTWNFDTDTAAKVPIGWSIRQTRPTEGLATWQVTADSTAPSKPNVLALTRTENYNGTFNLAIAENASFRDLDLTVKVKAVRGEEDQGGGPIWRCKDENNYYICRFNPLEGNYRVYRVVDGRRRQLESTSVKTVPGKWYTVRVVMVGDQITCYLDGQKLLETTDGTFKDSGIVGLWTKADAVTSFDDLVVRPAGVEHTGPPRLDSDKISKAAGSMHGEPVGPSMGLTTWAAFTGTDELAAVDGDFIMTAQEVQPILRALRKADIHIVALHNHMIGEHPTFYFTHFWGKGTVEELARGIKSALDAQRHAASAELPER